MSDGGRERASLEVGVSKSSQNRSVRRSAVRSIAWLDLFRKNWIIVSELKTFWEKRRIHPTVFFFDLFALLVRDAQHRIVEEIPDALLNLW
jgi:hypothetical protein